MVPSGYDIRRYLNKLRPFFSEYDRFCHHTTVVRISEQKELPQKRSQHTNLKVHRRRLAYVDVRAIQQTHHIRKILLVLKRRKGVLAQRLPAEHHESPVDCVCNDFQPALLVDVTPQRALVDACDCFECLETEISPTPHEHHADESVGGELVRRWTLGAIFRVHFVAELLHSVTYLLQLVPGATGNQVSQGLLVEQLAIRETIEKS
jgi:hypothetical protein